MPNSPAPIKTSAGMETVEQTVARAKKMVSTTPNAESPEPSAPPVSKVETPATPVVTPAPLNTTQAIESFTTVTPELLQQQRDMQARQSEIRGQGQDLYEGLLGLGTRGAATIRAEEEAGIGRLSTELTDIENELAQKSLSFRRERERIETQGGTAAQVNAILGDVSRKQNRELADLETIRAARSNSLTNAQNLVNRKVELEFGDKIAQVNALKFIYDENKDLLTKEEDRLFQQTIRREERGFEIAKQKFVQLENEKAKYLTNAAQAGADNNTLKTIQSAQDLDELYTMPGIQKFALSQKELLEIQAARQSIYSSAVSTRLALAKAGDANAIKELGFDPRQEEAAEPLDATTKRQLEQKMTGNENMLRLLKDYRAIIQTKGYTLDKPIIGDPATVGQLDSLRAQITAAYKDAQQLGTLDTGVLNLVSQVIGERPVTSFTGWGENNRNFLANIGGGQSRKLVAGLDSVIETTEADLAKTQIRLGIDPLAEAQFSPEENETLNAEFGVTTTTQQFDPNSYYK